MSAEILSAVATSVDPTWIGAMLFAYPVQFVVWTVLVAVIAFVFGFAWEKRKVGIAEAEADLMRAQHDVDVETMKSIQGSNRELLELNKKLMQDADEARRILLRAGKENRELLELAESVHAENESLLSELRDADRRPRPKEEMVVGVHDAP